MLLRAMRADRMQSALKVYIESEMGSKYTETLPFNVH